MKLTSKLLRFLNRVFEKRPLEYVALRLRYDGSMTWTVADGVLTTTVSGGSGVSLTVDLSQYTLMELAYYLVAQPGYSIPYVDRSDSSNLTARTLLDGTGDQSKSNGDALFAYTNPLFTYLEPVAAELETAGQQVVNALQQMAIPTSEGSWLDYWGSYFGVPRKLNEIDSDYATRMLTSILRPRSNNIAMAATISDAIGGQPVTVETVRIWGPTNLVFNGAVNFDGSKTFNNGTAPVYGLFDVTYGYDLLSTFDPSQLAVYVKQIVESVRAAGTQMQSLLLQSSKLSDSVTPPTDGNADQALALAQTWADTATAPTDAFSLIPIALGLLTDAVAAASEQLPVQITYATTFNGARTFNGSIPFQGGNTVAETL